MTDTTNLSTSKQIITVLHQAGALGPDMNTIISNLELPENKKWQSLQSSGKPASEIIIQQRRALASD